jgi:hypothetical protein
MARVRFEDQTAEARSRRGTMPYFVVINEQGPSWVDSRPMRDQKMWPEHAVFINSLTDAGFVILGGPLGPGKPHRAILIVNSESEAAARTRLLEDPWMQTGILRIGSLESWEILASNGKLDPVLADIARTDHRS